MYAVQVGLEHTAFPALLGLLSAGIETLARATMPAAFIFKELLWRTLDPLSKERLWGKAWVVIQIILIGFLKPWSNQQAVLLSFLVKFIH